MEIKCEKRNNGTAAFVLGEIDHHNAKLARTQLDDIIEAQRPICFFINLSGVNFCDSSGLGLIMGRMKKCQSCGCRLIIENPSPAAEKILEIAGMDRILKIERGN